MPAVQLQSPHGGIRIMAGSTHPRFRSLLFIPGNRADMLAKGPRYSPGGFIPDLEDSVPPGEKVAARSITAAAITTLAATGRAVVPRVNSLPTDRTNDDINAVVTAEVTAISIGKVGGAGDIQRVAEMLAAREKQLGLPSETVGILPWIETAAGIMNVYAICAASSRVRWIAFGAEDFSADMGISRTVDIEGRSSTGPYGEPGLLYARSAVTVAARAAGIQAFDTPFVLFRDPEALKNDCALARSIGYTGKMAIHPAQVEIIEEAFSPTAQEIERARRVLEVSDAAATDGRGSLSLDGEMVDAPVVARARNVLRDAGLLE
jgi:citrate lyase subunit beta/citryl-CoA lyase